VNAALAQRQLALAGVALLALVAAVVLVQHARDDPAGASGPPAVSTEWRSALAAPYSLPAGQELTACGQRTGEAILGVAHPVLPCGAKIVVRFDGQDVLTQVVDRGAGLPGREFDVTPALANRIGLTGVQQIQWRFAERPDGEGAGQ
jgi:rare lipoprotein A (RlpA)-like double-psi beta-barrel protein